MCIIAILYFGFQEAGKVERAWCVSGVIDSCLSFGACSSAGVLLKQVFVFNFHYITTRARIFRVHSPDWCVILSFSFSNLMVFLRIHPYTPRAHAPHRMHEHVII